MKWTIYKGFHSANILWRGYHAGNELRRTVIFDRSCYYNTLPEGEEGDWNKVGYWGRIWPWWDGVNFGWRWVNLGGQRAFQMGWYIHDNSPQHESGLMDSYVPPPDWKEIRAETYIRKFGKDTAFVLNIEDRGMETALVPKRIDGNWLTAPFFGGQAVAPHDIRIKIEKQ